MVEKSSIHTIVIFDIDGVIRDVGNSYRRAIADTVEHFTSGAYRPTSVDIDNLKSEGIWNNDWEASQEFIYRHQETQGQSREQVQLDYNAIVDFFQGCYRGTNPNNWTGYICHEPLLLQPAYLDQLTLAGIAWGFFSGAPRAEATYLLESRLGLQSPALIAMEDAPGKPDPTGLFAAIRLLKNQLDNISLVVYVGDTVADMYTVEKARNRDGGDRSINYLGVGILPPHVQEKASRRDAYAEKLRQAGATLVLNNVQELTPAQIQRFL
ncbi:TIGR01548 family HAD-type hydrolase [Calothrix rhizosoleniae]|uniref:TIGR01548 family HAD-type hydrolase n=1 Tax=Calothrix rhizosoleniae TaxID=888997 RepID=UPI000B4A5525|nr:TIGR01548 family HAD-type hydrolase [Calothrix rhizosoleniae]